METRIYCYCYSSSYFNNLIVHIMKYGKISVMIQLKLFSLKKKKKEEVFASVYQFYVVLCSPFQCPSRYNHRSPSKQ